MGKMIVGSLMVLLVISAFIATASRAEPKANETSSAIDFGEEESTETLEEIMGDVGKGYVDNATSAADNATSAR